MPGLEFAEHIHYRGIRPHPLKKGGLVMALKSSDNDDPVLELWSAPSWSMRSSTLWPGVVVSVRISSLDQIDLFATCLKFEYIVLFNRVQKLLKQHKKM